MLDSDEFNIFDESDPQSLINIVPREIKDLLLQVPTEWLKMTENELELFCEPDGYTGRLRLAFWSEFERSRVRVERMSLARMANMMGAPEKHILPYFKSTKRCAWILCAPSSYEFTLDEALNCGMRRLRNDILDMPIRDENGKVDHKAAELLLKAIAFIDMRRHGGIVQKNLNVNTSVKEMKAIGAEMTLNEINARIAELEKQGDVSAAQKALPENTIIEVPSVRTDKETMQALEVKLGSS